MHSDNATAAPGQAHHGGHAVTRPLRVLIVEDSIDDAELLLMELRRGGYDVSYERVQTADAMRRALAEGTFDLVLSDYSMPSFSAMVGLQIHRESGVDIPFILVSGTIGEETAVEALKAGAHDFLIKGRLARLVPAIERELREARVHRERLEALRKVAESERSFSVVFHQMAVGMLQAELSGRVTAANQRLCDILGLPMPTLLGMTATELGEGQAFARIAAGERSLVHEHPWVRPDGATVWLSSTVTGVVGDTAPANAVAIVQDLTDRWRAEEGLREAVKARDEFLSIASHELKTPITALGLQLASALELLSGQPGEPRWNKLQSRLAGAERQVDRLTTLINQLLDVTRITAGRLALAPERVDLAKVVRAVLARSQELVRRAGSAVSVEADPAIGQWDPVALEAVAVNLLSNALKFGAGRPVAIRVAQHQGRARLVVRDHGIGIAPEAQTRIFERFERAVPSQHYGGFGIGLWIVRQVVEAHGGTIRVESAAGAGTTFTVELPTGAPAEETSRG